MTKTLIAALLGSALLITGAAGVVQAQPAKKAVSSARTDCFFNRQVQSYTAANDDKTLYVRAGKNTYRLETFSRCLDLSSALNIGLDSHPSSSICSALDVTIVVPSSSMGPQRCAVRTLVKLTPEQIAALPKGDRP
ncbi:DUF6491 family protein [Caulobacter sp. NIBR1757]|uniref:DUF6491 family protein n=1 Tax=Caulobacter sp. NIBR1757 TaxID=3016000 RepID=UPI0022F02137|nr:DUF6491 family protein [Caulobacter sp. NIBR1757]WGM37164.1 hypothetical protein AMEJIAPC_00058 [Caulobacter sp. NIBR1757]